MVTVTRGWAWMYFQAFFHFGGPVNVVRDEEGVVVGFGEAGFKITDRGFVTVISVEENKLMTFDGDQGGWVFVPDWASPTGQNWKQALRSDPSPPSKICMATGNPTTAGAEGRCWACAKSTVFRSFPSFRCNTHSQKKTPNLTTLRSSITRRKRRSTGLAAAQVALDTTNFRHLLTGTLAGKPKGG